MKELEKIKLTLDDSFTFARGVSDLGHRMSQADLVISAGGNTLYEMACIGSPGLVLWEDPHEENLGQAFEEQGMVTVLGNGLECDINDISQAVADLVTDNLRLERMSRQGRKIVDGRGCMRVCDRILNLLN